VHLLTSASASWLEELFTPTVSLPPWIFHRDCSTACVEWCVCCCRPEESHCSSQVRHVWLSAAFDTIDHDVLLERLDHRFGVRDAASSWLHSYLTNRQQFVKLGRHSSVIMPCGSGIPQGSVLGPLLFTAYTAPVSDLIESFGVCCHQFADDTQLFIAMNVADTTPLLNSLTCCSAVVKQWSLQNDLQLNAGKSEVILLSTAVQLQSVANITMQMVMTGRIFLYSVYSAAA